MFNRDAFSKMKRSSIFINVARGQLVDEEALIEALEQKEIAGAGLDVFKNEPISSSHPLLQFENVVALPHIGSSSKETRMNMIELAIRNVVKVLKGEEPETPV